MLMKQLNDKSVTNSNENITSFSLQFNNIYHQVLPQLIQAWTFHNNEQNL